MAFANPNPNGSRFVYVQQWSQADKISEVDLGRMYLSHPTKIGPALTFLYGRQNAFMNPITMMTEGLSNTEGLDNMEYEYDAFGTTYRTIPLAAACAASNAGQGYTEFELVFPEKYFPRYYTIMTPNQYQIRIESDPKPFGSNWKYTCKYIGATSSSDYVPSSELQAGIFFVKGWYNSAAWGSVGSSSTITSTAKIRGNISVLRKSMQLDGSVANRDLGKDVTVVLPDGNGGETKAFWSFLQWQLDMGWNQEIEDHYLYGTSSRAADGSYPFSDEEGNPLIIGNQLFAQVGVKDTFGYTLPANKLGQAIRDTFANMKDSENKEITLITGYGGAEDFDLAMKNSVLGSGFTTIGDRTFIKETGVANRYRSTGFFTEYEHVDGYVVKVKVSDIFNYGPITKNAPKHPRSGLSLESHRMLFLDTSNYDGQPNLKGLYDKTIPFTRDPIKGVGTPPPGFPATSASSDRHGHSIQYMKSCGVVLRRWNTSMDFRCVIS